MTTQEVIIYSGQEWQRMPELDAPETLAYQNEYGQIIYMPMAEAVEKYATKSAFPWWIVAAVGGLFLI